MEKFNNKRVLITGGASGIGRLMGAMAPEYAARKIIRAIEKNKRVAVITRLIPFPYHFVRLMQGVLPTKLFDLIFGQIFEIYHSMDNFTGKK